MKATESGWAALVALALIAIQLPALSRNAVDPGQSDFANYFVPARVLSQGGDIGVLYQRDAFDQATREADLSTLGSFIPHPPTNALWLLPFAGLRPTAAKGLWTLTLLFALAAALWMTGRLWPGGGPWLPVVLVMAPTLAVRNGLAFGQPYLILGTLLLGGVLAWQTGRIFAGGFLLGLGAGFKPYALPVGALFLHRARLLGLVGFGCGAATPVLVLLALSGSGPLVEFMTKVAPWMARGDIQDPFAAGWGSIGALANRLFRFEPDLNPAPFADLSVVAAFIGAAIPAALVALGVGCGLRAVREGNVPEAVGVIVALALSASPFVASYHLVLLILPVTAVAMRLNGTPLLLWLLAWAGVGSPLMNLFRSAPLAPTPLAYGRFMVLLGLALVLARPWLSRSLLVPVAVVGVVGGVAVASRPVQEETWPRVEEARGYSMSRPFFCGTRLRWWSPSPDGRQMESLGEGEDCQAIRSPTSRGPEVISRFTDGSWNLFLRSPEDAVEPRLTFSGANEVDPVITPDGCAVVFASDQGRGLGSTALYRLDLSSFIAGCGKGRPAAVPPE